MTVTCEECRSVFRVDPAKVPAGGVRARCSVCGAVLLVGMPRGTPARAAPAVAPALAGVGPAAPSWTSGEAAVIPRAPALPPSATRPTPMPASVTTTTPVAGTPAMPRQTPAAGWTSVAPRGASPTPPPVAAGLPPGTPPVSGAIAPRRVNPFMTADPNQRARRLARALVSDIVAYHPQKRDDGLRNGTLKQLFRDEIKKSYEEYVEQVGRELAEATSHFQDALNDVLAGGRRLF
jgi:predicted Zn finger-like uncharacterized protein